MNYIEQAKRNLNRAAAVSSVQIAQASALCAIGYALLAIQEELVKEDKVLPSLPSHLQDLAKDCGAKFELTTKTCVAKDETVDDTPRVPPLSPVGTSQGPLWFGNAPVVDEEEEPLPSLNDDTIVIDGKVWHRVPDDEEELDGFESP